MLQVPASALRACDRRAPTGRAATPNTNVFMRNANRAYELALQRRGEDAHTANYAYWLERVEQFRGDLHPAVETFRHAQTPARSATAYRKADFAMRTYVGEAAGATEKEYPRRRKSGLIAVRRPDRPALRLSRQYSAKPYPLKKTKSMTDRGHVPAIKTTPHRSRQGRLPLAHAVTGTAGLHPAAAEARASLKPHP